MGMFHHANTNKKKVEVAIFTLDKVDFRAKSITKSKEGVFIMTKGKILLKNTTNLNIYVFNKSSPKNIKQKQNCCEKDINPKLYMENSTLFLKNY